MLLNIGEQKSKPRLVGRAALGANRIHQVVRFHPVVVSWTSILNLVIHKKGFHYDLGGVDAEFDALPKNSSRETNPLNIQK